MKSPFYTLYFVVIGLCIYHEALPRFTFSSTLSLLLYGGLLWHFQEKTFDAMSVWVGQLVYVTSMSAALCVVLVKMKQHSYMRQRLLSQAQTLSKVADILNGSHLNLKEAVKNISGLLEDEMTPEGIHCRITLHSSKDLFLPPSGGKFGIHIPIMAGDFIAGTMMISRKNSALLTPQEHHFFNSIATSLSIALHRARLWDQMQSEIKDLETKVYEEKTPAPEPVKKIEVAPIKPLPQSKPAGGELPGSRFDLKSLLVGEMLQFKQKAEERGVIIEMYGTLETLPQVHGDREKLRQVISNLYLNAFTNSPDKGKISIHLLNQGAWVGASIEDQGEGGDVGPINFVSPANQETQNFLSGVSTKELDLGFLFIQKTIQSHQGRFSAYSKGVGQGRRFSFVIPVDQSYQTQTTVDKKGQSLLNLNS